MTKNPVVPFACHVDFVHRISVPMRRRTVILAEHLIGHPFLPLAEILIADMKAGRHLAIHLSPMKNQRKAFKRAHRKDDWVDYKRMMDHLLNKWGFRHFHCGRGSILVFVHLCEETGIARVLDLISHNGDWLIEKRLVSVAVRNWPDSGITRSFGEGPTSMTEEDLLAARKQGLNMTVNVNGTYYLPARGGLMSDGSGYGGLAFAPFLICCQRYERHKKPSVWLDSPTSLVLGLDPEDPRLPWEVAAGQTGLLASAHLPKFGRVAKLPVVRNVPNPEESASSGRAEPQSGSTADSVLTDNL